MTQDIQDQDLQPTATPGLEMVFTPLQRQYLDERFAQEFERLRVSVRMEIRSLNAERRNFKAIIEEQNARIAALERLLAKYEGDPNYELTRAKIVDLLKLHNIQ